MAIFDSKSFNAEAFGAYVKRIPNTRRTALVDSGAIGTNQQARQKPTGSRSERSGRYGLASKSNYTY